MASSALSPPRVSGPALWWQRWWIPLAIFAGSRVVGAVLILLTGRDQLPGPPTVDDDPPWNLDDPSYGSLIQSWDGLWYRQIVEEGYPRTLPVDSGGAVRQNAWAFYPLLPGLLRAVTATGLPFGVAVTVVGLGACLVALCLCFRLVAAHGGVFAATTTTLALAMFPSAPVLQMAYTESLALALLLVGLWLLVHRHYAWLPLPILLLALTRPIVLVLVVVIAAHGWTRWRRRDSDPLAGREVALLGGSAVLALAAFALWPTVCGLVTGVPDAYLQTQRGWGGDRQGRLITWVSGVVEGSPSQILLVLGSLAALAWILLRRSAADRWPFELRIWALAAAAYIVVATLPTGAVFRYALLMVLPWWPWPGIGQRLTGRPARVALLAGIVLVGALSQWLWLRWFFVFGPQWVSHP